MGSNRCTFWQRNRNCCNVAMSLLDLILVAKGIESHYSIACAIRQFQCVIVYIRNVLWRLFRGNSRNFDTRPVHYCVPFCHLFRKNWDTTAAGDEIYFHSGPEKWRCRTAELCTNHQHKSKAKNNTKWGKEGKKYWKWKTKWKWIESSIAQFHINDISP